MTIEPEQAEEALARARLALDMANAHARFAPATPHSLFARADGIDRLTSLLRDTLTALARQVDRVADEAVAEGYVLTAGVEPADVVCARARQALQAAATRVEQACDGTRRAVHALEKLRLSKP